MKPCPGDLELASAIADGADPSLSSHLDECAGCRATWDGSRRAIELARELPVEIPPHVRREEVRTAVLAAGARATTRPSRRWTWFVPAIAGAAAAGIVAYLAIPQAAAPVPRAHGTIHGHASAHYLTSSPPPDEIVQLFDGVIDVEVEPLHPGERFRIVLGDAEIEVRGTAFTVTAAADHLIDVSVAHGRVDVRPRASGPTTLGAGESWHVAIARKDPEPAPPAPIAIAPALHSVPVPHAAQRITPPPATIEQPGHETVEPRAAEPATDSRPAAPPRAVEDVAYDEAWDAMRRSNFARAAGAFSRVLLLAPESALVEDASFWRAVALARGKRNGEAIIAFRDFLDAHAGSSRAGEASAMLGWMLIDARDYDEAARRFKTAASDVHAAVRASATSGLAVLARRKP